MHRRALGLATALALIGVAALALSCSSKTTAPGGGGGGGGLTFDSGPIAGNGSLFDHTFPNVTSNTNVGYHCNIHGGMTGTVAIMLGGPSTATVIIQNSTATGFNPQTVQIGPGGIVTWVNNDTGVTHTATSN